MTLPLKPPVLPQLSRSAKTLPLGDGWSYEPKWDGFRAIAFVDGDDVYLQSRNGKPLTRYFPELSFPAGRYVIDGEIVLFDGQGRQDFDALGERIHPAESRIRMLAEQTPADYAVFDLLVDDGKSLIDRPLGERRERLEALAERLGLELTTLTQEKEVAEEWLRTTEGVVAKRLDAPYTPGERKGMVKVKRERTIDCVVMGWRPGKKEGTVGSLILGLYDGDDLRPVGHISGFKAKQKRDLRVMLAPLETGDRGSGDPSRWRSGQELEWVSLRPELVIEVGYDHASAGRIRHGTRFLRFRDDKAPRECRFEDLDEGA